MSAAKPPRLPGQAAAVLAVMGADGDLLVLGGRAGHDMERLVHGSVSHYCCQHARCPAVIVRARAARHHRVPSGPPGSTG